MSRKEYALYRLQDEIRNVEALLISLKSVYYATREALGLGKDELTTLDDERAAADILQIKVPVPLPQDVYGYEREVLAEIRAGKFPFFSETTLYALVGKDDARRILKAVGALGGKK